MRTCVSFIWSWIDEKINWNAFSIRTINYSFGLSSKRPLAVVLRIHIRHHVKCVCEFEFEVFSTFRLAKRFPWDRNCHASGEHICIYSFDITSVQSTAEWNPCYAVAYTVFVSLESSLSWNFWRFTSGNISTICSFVAPQQVQRVTLRSFFCIHGRWLTYVVHTFVGEVKTKNIWHTKKWRELWNIFVVVRRVKVRFFHIYFSFDSCYLNKPIDLNRRWHCEWISKQFIKAIRVWCVICDFRAIETI